MKKQNICGERLTINEFEDCKVKELNLELIISKKGTPLISFQDWNKDKELFSLHVKS